MSNWPLDRWLAVLGLCGTTLGVLASVYFWLKPRQEAIPCYKSRVLQLIAPTNQEYYFSSTDISLQVHYGGEASDRVSKLFVAIWNAGHKTLDSADAVGQAPLTIALPPQTRIWGEPKVLATTREEIAFQARLDPAGEPRVLVDFLFLDFKDGGLLELLCAGSVDDYEVRGVFKGSRSLQNRGRLGLRLVMPPRERIIRTLPQLLTGGPAAWFLRVEALLLVILFCLFAVTGVGGLVFGLVLVLALAAAIVAGVPGETSELQGSRRGVPQSLRRIAFEPDERRSQAASALQALLEDLRSEARRRRQGLLSPWEQARQKKKK